MMKILNTFTLLFALSVQAFASKSDPTVVSTVDFNRYSGFWYEVAHSPNFFQKKCLRSTAEYAVIDGTSVSVKNTCYKKDQKISMIEGVAKVADSQVPAKLKVRFSFFQRGDYWITELAPDYSWAVVSGPKKKYNFILSRQPHLADATLKTLIETLKSKGYDVDQLVYDQN